MKSSVVAKQLIKVIITVARGKLNLVILELIRCGCFHPLPLEPGSRGSQHITNVRRLLTEVESLISRIDDVQEEAANYGITYTGEFKPPELRVRDWMKTATEVLSEAYVVVEEAEEAIKELRETLTPAEELAELYDLLAKYSFINFNFELFKNSKYIKMGVYRVPNERLGVFEDMINASGKIFGIIVSGVEEGFSLAILFYPSDAEVEVDKAVSEARAVAFRMPPGLPQNPAEAVKRLQARAEEAKRRLMELMPRLVEVKAKLEAVRAALRILEATRLTRLFAIITGYLPKELYPQIAKRLDEVTGGALSIYAESETVAAPEGEGGISEVKVPKLLEPFKDLVLMYSYPRPRELVPILLTAITFPILYGLMFPDLGHGLVLLAIGILAYMGKMPLFKGESGKKWGLMLIYLGISASFFGFLAGEFFGPHPAVAGWLNAFWHGHPPYASPVHPLALKAFQLISPEEAAREVTQLVMFTFYVALGFGSILLMIASWLGLINAILLGTRREILKVVARVLIFTGIALAFIIGGSIAGAAMIFAGVVFMDKMLHITLTPMQRLAADIIRTMIGLGLLLVFIEPIIHGEAGESLGMRIFMGFMEAFDMLLLMISNTVSFVRIMGLMLAHSGLMYGFTVLSLLICHTACSIINAFFAAIIYLIGNILTFGLEAIIAFAHTLRLHFYEMFSKFYEGGGIPYEPVVVRMPVRIMLA
ncbi:MAG: hypothetical protein GXO09_02320 [Crenarchaeota archaeon]|nr:hypothetical protein [Thermoproteota archaeon]